jgi:Leucine-rich repeat (LRR) protein
MPFLADKMKKLTTIFTLFVLLVLPVFATTIHIPGDYPTIQEGIDVAFDGDTVLVSAGTYVDGETSYNGKSISIISVDGPENTFIGRIIVVNGEDEGTTLSGFTFEDIFRPVAVNSNSYLSIDNCIFINNEEETISCDFGSNLSVSNVLIDGGRNGIKSAQGGCEISVENTTIVNMWDPAIDIRDEAQLTMVNSILENNSNDGNPIHYWTNPPVYLNLFYNNINGTLLDENGELFYCEYEEEGVECNVSNNINTDPQFIDPDNGDFTLQPNSPCIDAGDPNSPLDPDSTIADMGAYYYDQSCTEETEVELWGECYNIEETTELVISNSGLTGEIPTEIGNLTNLTFLDLRDNELSGHIPSDMGNLINLNVLLLSNNQLSGEIPTQIGNLSNLITLNFEENELS